MYFDAHSDIWCDVTTRRLNGETNVFDRCHLERMRKGGVEGSIFVIWVDPPYDVDYVKRTEQIMAAAKAEIAECQSFRIVHTYDEMMQANADGKIYIFIGIEGMATMGKDLSWIDRYYDFGCRHGILTWNEANDLGAGALSGKDYGLTDVGKEAVRRMQEKGMLLDVSHLNDNGFWDLVKITQKPFVASHSNSRALCSAPRNLTDDQLRAIAEIKGDMERSTPMDRLLCGDVGYGKTEVALRAAMKCILDGKQVALLVPTTVLAQQHYATAAARFRAFPVTVEVLSRFRTPKQVKDVLERVKDGRVDLLIGTHKLLGKGVQFKDLGLLIIDEEQRFGVTHKERLRQVARQVDTLTLSATPIPRTLNMAMSGIRDMSTIEQPPQDRQSVQTYVLEHDWGLLADAIRRELGRGGQVYYLHNRVDSIDATAARLRDLLGEDVAIETAHGKMAEGQLSAVMARMSEGEIDVLVCTTIIETGIDIPNVNTLIIEDADNMGLSQLHQLRGRIGRSPRRAYAYLTYRAGKVLTEVAAKRLTAIREYVEFGSGFKIAMRDLEIRGAGDLLGAEQSGHMMTVGYDMYLKLLEDAVLEERGEEAQKEPECTADLTVTANINKDYVTSGEQRMDLYRRMAAIRTQEDADELLDEIVDRFGDPPKGVMNLIAIALLRARAAAAGITEITQKDGAVLLSLSTMDFAAISACCAEAQFKGRIFFSAGKVPMLSVKLKKAEDPLKLATQLVGVYAALRAQTAGA